MKIVAKFQLTAPADSEATMDEVSATIKRWGKIKFSFDDDGIVRIRKTGAQVEYESSEEIIDGLRRDSTLIIEDVDGGTLQTEISTISDGNRVAFRCILGLVSEAGVAPADVQIRAPRFVRDIVNLRFPWTVGTSGEHVFAQHFRVEGEDIDQLVRLLRSRDRRLPLVAVSEQEGEVIAGDIHERLSQDLCGLAHVVRLSEEASWDLTKIVGKEWSCFNGAVRLYWPFTSNSDNFRAHPLWTFDQVTSRAASLAQGRDQLRGAISRKIIEASTFVSDDTAFREFEVNKIRHAGDMVRAAASADGDMQALADAYAHENDALRTRIDEQDAQIELLEKNTEALMIALRSFEAQNQSSIECSPPQTVEEAVLQAKEKQSPHLLIATETDEFVSDLNPAAGPPDKILRYLETLSDLSEALSQGSLGKTVPIWLRDRGVECSGDSTTEKNSRDGRSFRTRSINGEMVECEFHAKPNDSVSPDMCVRIYFATSSTSPHVKIGYIGRHNG